MSYNNRYGKELNEYRKKELLAVTGEHEKDILTKIYAHLKNLKLIDEERPPRPLSSLWMILTIKGSFKSETKKKYNFEEKFSLHWKKDTDKIKVNIS